MKHDWICHKAPVKDKVVNRDKVIRAPQGKQWNPAQYHLVSGEEVVILPGIYYCSNCHTILHANFKPLDGWTDILPDCLEGQTRLVMES